MPKKSAGGLPEATAQNPVLSALQLVPNAHDSLLDSPATAAQVLRARISLKVSQKALAIEMGISQMYLCDLEKSRRRWSLRLFNGAKAALERLSSQ